MPDNVAVTDTDTADPATATASLSEIGSVGQDAGCGAHHEPHHGSGNFPGIADYAFLSDCETNCLISPSGAVEWMCIPRPDSPSMFTAILDRAGGSFRIWAVAAVLLGAGTAMVYPTLLAAIGDVAHPAWRARAVGTYRLWRDGGFAVGAVLAGVLADLYGVRMAIGAVAALTAASALVVAVRMYETRHDPAPALPVTQGGPR